jgi:rhodanese-related sulfurtransferase
MMNPHAQPPGAPTLATRRTLAQQPAADPAEAAAHYQRLLSLETDCWDVHHALQRGESGFVVLDVRSPESFAAGHVPGAIHLPHGRITERALEAFPADILFVVYCNGPHCNGADRAAARLAGLGRRVRKMIGGVEGWKDEGFSLSAPD